MGEIYVYGLGVEPLTLNASNVDVYGLGVEPLTINPSNVDVYGLGVEPLTLTTNPPAPSGTGVLSVALSPYLAGVLDLSFYQNSAYAYAGSSVSLVYPGFSGQAGFLGACSDGASGSWVSQIGGPIIQIPKLGSITAYNMGASNITLTGLTYNTVEASPYSVSNTGTVYTINSGASGTVNTAFGGPCRFAETSGSTIFTLIPTSGLMAWLHLSGATTGTSGSTAAPMTIPYCLAVASGLIAVGGINYAQIPSGFTDMAINPINYRTLLGVVSGSGTLSAWIDDTSGNWSLVSTVTGLGQPANVSWSPDRSFALTTDPTNGNIFYTTYSFETLTLKQTFALPDAGPLAIALGSAAGLVCQTSGSSLQPIAFNGTSWSASGNPLFVGSPKAILMSGPNTAVVANTSGLTQVALASTGGWSLGNTLALSFAPTSLYLDSASNIYAAGASGPSGYFAIVSPQFALTASGSWVGGSAGIACVQQQLVVGDPTNSLVRVFGYSPVTQTWVQQTSGAAPGGLTNTVLGGLVGSYQDFFAAGSGAAWQYNFGGPYHLDRTKCGAVAVYSGSWATALALPTGQLPECMAWDPSGNVSVSTLNNTLYTVTSGATVSGTYTIPQTSGQPQSTMLGLSRLVWLNGHLYSARSMNSSMLEVV